MRPDVPRPPREPGAGPPVATPSGRRVRVLLALALAGLAATTAGTAQVPASAGVPASADGPVPADVPAGGDGPTAGSDYDWPVAGDPPEVAHPFDPPPRPWLPGHRGVDLSAEDGAEVRAAGPGTVAFAGHVAGRPVVSIQHRSEERRVGKECRWRWRRSW